MRAITYNPFVMLFWKVKSLINKGHCVTVLSKTRKYVFITFEGKRRRSIAYASPKTRQRSMFLAGIDKPLSRLDKFRQFFDDIDTWFYARKKRRDLSKGIYETERERMAISIDSIKKGSLASRIEEFDRPSFLANPPIFGTSHNPYYKDLVLQ